MHRHLGIAAMALLLIGFNGNPHTQKQAQADKDQHPAFPSAAIAPIPPGDINKSASQSPEAKSEEHVKAEVRVIETPAKDGFDIAAFVISVVLAAVGLLGVGVGFRTLGWLRIQTQAAQDAANAAKDSAAATLLQITMMKKKERARLVITPLSEGYWKTLHEASGILRSSIKIDHFGTTDAFKVRGFFTISVSDSNRVPPRSDIWAQMDIPEVIKTDSPPLFPQHEYFWWTKEDLPKILSENAFLIFYGMIIFEDMFDEEQTEEFGFYWFVDHASIEKGLPGNSRWVECDSEESQKKRERLRKRLFPFVD